MSRRGAVMQDYGGIFPEISHDAEKAAASYYQRDKEQNKDIAARENQQKQKQGADSTKFITELKNEKTGVNDIDIENDKQLLAAQNKMIEMQQKGAPLSEIQIYAMRELPKINNAYTLGKNYKAQVEKGMTDLEKKYGNGVDLNAVQSQAYKKMADDIFERDAKGNITGYKDPSLIPKNRDYISDIENDSQSLGTVFKPSGAFDKGVQDTDLIPIKGGTTRTDKYGKKVKQTYTGFGTIYDQPILNEQGEQVGWDVKGDAVPLGRNEDGTVIMEMVMPKEQFEIATSTPSAKKDFEIKFNDYLNQSGTNPDKLDARAKDVLQRKFAYDMFKQTGMHGSSFLPVDEVKEAPVKNITNIRVNSGKDVPVMDIVTPVESYFKKVDGSQKEGLKGVAQLNLFNNEVTTPIVNEVKNRYPDITADNIYYQKDGEDIWVMKADEAGKVNRTKDVPVFKLDDFSNISGNKTQGQKSKNKALVEAEGKQARENKTAQTGYSWNGYDYSEDEIMQAAAAEKLSKDAYLKKHGIKKK